MLSRLENIRKRLLQFSNFWFRLEEKTRHVVLVIVPLLAAVMLTGIMSIIDRAIEKYSGSQLHIFIFWFIVSSVAMFIVVWLFAIIMDERRKIEEQMCRDCLTGVYTRRYTYEEAVKLIAEASRSNKIICVCFVDLDNLKPINDAYSHAAGDEALILIGKTLLSAVRINDLVGRYGGDEFLLIWSTDDVSTINDTFKRINDALGRMAFTWHGREIAITASSGLSHGYCEPRSDPEKRLKDLIRQADSVLKGTKKYKSSNNN
jgi:diguanylate cyclase (GGDEF)-like protein